MHNHNRNIIFMHDFFRALTVSSGGGGGARAPQAPPLGPAPVLIKILLSIKIVPMIYLHAMLTKFTRFEICKN